MIDKVKLKLHDTITDHIKDHKGILDINKFFRLAVDPSVKLTPLTYACLTF